MKQLFTLLTLLVFKVSLSQTTIDGKISDNKGRPVIAASVNIKGSYDGTISDSSGNYSFETFETGKQIIVVTSVGYNTVETEVVIANKRTTVNVILKEKRNELQAVVVTAGAFAAGDGKRASTVLNTLDILTVGGGNADITTAVKTLPGAQQVGESEGLFVRGGEGYETKQFIDGTMVDHPYFSGSPNVATRGRFNPALFRETVFAAGGYSALYGQALSSALILETVDMPEKTEASIGVSPLFLSAGYQSVSRKKNFSWGMHYAYTNVKLYFELVKQRQEYFQSPEFHNLETNFRWRTKNGIIKFYSLLGKSKLGVKDSDIDSLDLKNVFAIENFNWYNNISWRENWGGGWKTSLGLGFSYNSDRMCGALETPQGNKVLLPGMPWESKNFTLNKTETLVQIKPVIEKKLDALNVFRLGGELWIASDKPVFNDSAYPLRDHLAAAFAETDIYLNNDVALKIGGRYEYSSLLKKGNVAPRVALAWQFNKVHQLSAAYGIFYQKPENKYLYFRQPLGFMKSTHYILNYQRKLAGRIARIEAFYKQYNHLIRQTNFTGYNNGGDGYAQGVELFWRDKKSVRNFDYWISYSYLDTKRDYLNFPYSIHPNFAAAHTLSVVLKRFFLPIKTGFNFTYSFATGRPYYDIRYNTATAQYDIADEGRTTPFSNLGFSLNYVPSAGNPKAKTFLVLVASVSNVLGHDQVYNYQYSYNGKYREPIKPPAPRFFFIGLFVNWGIDRTQEIIDSNL